MIILPLDQFGWRKPIAYIIIIYIYFLIFFFTFIFPRGAGLDRKHKWLIFKSSPAGRDNSRRKILGEKPSLGSSWWDLNLWPLTPQSSALTTRPPNIP